MKISQIEIDELSTLRLVELYQIFIFLSTIFIFYIKIFVLVRLNRADKAT